jgi:site-specific DNA-cytosine methylase
VIRPDELIVDSFAGGGGASLGIEMALGRSPDIGPPTPEHPAGRPLTKTAQIRMCGNSVCPPVAAAIIRANLGTAANEEETEAA